MRFIDELIDRKRREAAEAPEGGAVPAADAGPPPDFDRADLPAPLAWRPEAEDDPFAPRAGGRPTSGIIGRFGAQPGRRRIARPLHETPAEDAAAPEPPDDAPGTVPAVPEASEDQPMIAASGEGTDTPVVDEGDAPPPLRLEDPIRSGWAGPAPRDASDPDGAQAPEDGAVPAAAGPDAGPETAAPGRTGPFSGLGAAPDVDGSDADMADERDPAARCGRAAAPGAHGAAQSPWPGPRDAGTARPWRPAHQQKAAPRPTPSAEPAAPVEPGAAATSAESAEAAAEALRAALVPRQSGPRRGAGAWSGGPTDAPAEPAPEPDEGQRTAPWAEAAAAATPGPAPDTAAASEPAVAPDPAPDPAPPRPAGRVKTRLLGFHTSDAGDDPLSASPRPAAAEAAPARFPVGWLVVEHGPGRGTAFALFDGLSTIGRAEGQTVQLDLGDTAISRDTHAAIAYDDETRTCYLGHGGKANLVRLNGRPVLSTESVAHGDRIRVGETTLRFVALCGPDFSWSDAAEEDGPHAATR